MAEKEYIGEQALLRLLTLIKTELAKYVKSDFSISVEEGDTADVIKTKTENGIDLHFIVPRGTDGKTPVKGVDYFDGNDGYTPVRGTDYWTEDDKSEINSYIIERTPTKTVFLTPDGNCYDPVAKKPYSIHDILPNDETAITDVVNFNFFFLVDEAEKYIMDWGNIDPLYFESCCIHLDCRTEGDYIYFFGQDDKMSILGKYVLFDGQDSISFTVSNAGSALVKKYNIRETIYIGLDGYCYGANGIAYPINNLDKDKIMDYNFILVYDDEGYDSPYNYHLESAYIPLTVIKVSDNGLGDVGYCLRAITLDESSECLIIEAYIDYELGEVPFSIYPMFDTKNGYINSYYGEISVNKKALLGDIGNITMKKYTDDKIGDIETALDGIIAIQNSLIGGDAE